MEMEWVIAEGKTVDKAVEAALQELKLSSPDQANIEVIQDPQRGFLGMGGKDAVVRVEAKPKKRRRRRRRGGSGQGGQGGGQGQSGQQGGEGRGEGRGRRDGGRAGGGGRGGGGRGDGGRGGGREGAGREAAKSAGGGGSGRSGTPDGGRGGGKSGGDESRSSKVEPKKDRSPKGTRQRGPRPDQKPAQSEEDRVDIEGQAAVVDAFLVDLLEAFGLEGTVTTRTDDGVIFAEVTGEQTEALVGNRGTIMQAVLELARTVVQRKSRDSARIRLDIAGYGERRREALRIYAGRLAGQVLEDGFEVMLEPMNPGDRKVVHDVIAEIEGVRSFSEGEEPNRSVVVGLAPGVEPRDSAGEGEGDETPDDEVSQDDADSTPDDDEATPVSEADDQSPDDSVSDDEQADDGPDDDEQAYDEADDDEADDDEADDDEADDDEADDAGDDDGNEDD